MSIQSGSFLALLEPSDRERFEAFAREPSRKIDQLMDWLIAEGGLLDSKKAPGHPRRVARTNVWRWFKTWRETDKLRVAIEIADALHTTSAELGTPDLAGAINLQVAQRLQDQLMRIKNPDVTSLSKMALTLNRIATSQQRLNDLIREQKEAIRAGEAAAKSGATAVDALALIKKHLRIGGAS